MRKPTALVLALILCLSLTACTPAEEAIPTPVPTETVTPSLTPAITPTAVPTVVPTSASTPEPTEELSRDFVIGEGYSYTSETLGIKIEFPPQWQWYFDFREDESQYDNFVLDAPEGNVKTAVISLVSKYVGESTPLAYIYWMPREAQYANDFGGYVRLWESDEGAYYCWMWTMLELSLTPEFNIDTGKFPDVTLAYAICESVQHGIANGRWAIEVLEK